jgi:UDP-4-amino-4,6-dideoxy-N-acetyl-beta-L-altrosamine transaminase
MDTLAIEGGRPVRESLIPYGRQWIDEDDIDAVVRVLRSDLITQGPWVERFERAVADYVGTRYAVAFSSGTAALHGACFAAGIGPGDEVITTPITFAASSNCVLYQGGTPVFADIRGDTYNIDPDEIGKKITSRTKALIPVDFTGQPAEMDRIRELAEKHRLIVIQDAAHSLGARYKGTKVGKWADMTMFSFHPVKHVTSGEGGVIVTDNETFYRKMLLFRTHGIAKEPSLMENGGEGPWYYEMQELGFNYRITDIQAALGCSQMTKLDRFIARRREIVRMYNEAFRELAGVRLPEQAEGAESSWHLYVLRFDPARFSAGRKRIFEALRAENIGVQVHYIPVYHHRYYRRLGYGKGLCKEAESFYEQAITLPVFPKMTDRDVADVIAAVRKVHHFYYRKI